jgi:basic membrane protein A and related proteins
MSSKKFVYFLFILLAACTPGTPTPSPTPEPSPTPTLPKTVCLVTDVGRITDGTFNQYAYEGMQALTQYHEGVTTDYIETQSEEDYAANIAQCIENGAEIVVTVGFLITQATADAARANPSVYFIGVDQDANSVENPPTNFAGTQAREDQAGFLVGVIAAVVANDLGGDIIAGVYGIDVPAVKRFRNGYEQGALYVNPDWVIGENILGSYTDSFLDEEQGASLATQYMGDGAVVIFGAGGPTGSGAIRAAAEAGVFVIGVDKDEYVTTFQGGEATGAEFIITSAVKRVDTAVYEVASLLVEGRFAEFPGGSNYIMDVLNSGVGFADSHDAVIPADAFEQATSVFEAMVNGTLETGVDPVTGDLLSALGEPTAEATEEATAEATEAE